MYCCVLWVSVSRANVFPRNLGETPWLYWWQAAIPDRRILAEMPLLQLCWKFVGATGMALDLKGKNLKFSVITLPETNSSPLNRKSVDFMNKNHSCLGYIVDYTTQICGDYNYDKRYKHPCKTNSIMKSCVFLWLSWFHEIQPLPRGTCSLGTWLAWKRGLKNRGKTEGGSCRWETKYYLEDHPIQ